MLPVSEIVLLAGIQGLTEALPVSRSAHDAIAWIWLDRGASVEALEQALHLGTAAAFFVFARRRLALSLGAGLRAVARPSLLRTSPSAHEALVLLVAAGVSLSARAILRPFVELWSRTPLAVGFGLLLSGLVLGATALAPRGRAEAPSLVFAALLGLGHALGALPGGSDVGAALVLAIWMGTKPDLALDLAVLLSGVTLVASFVTGARELFANPPIGAVPMLLGLSTAFLGATAALGLLKKLLERRALPILSLWVFCLGFATISYARAAATATHSYKQEEPLMTALASRPEDDSCNRIGTTSSP